MENKKKKNLCVPLNNMRVFQSTTELFQSQLFLSLLWIWLINSFIYPSADASVNASETQQPNGPTVQPTGTTNPGDTSDSQTTTQLIIIQQTTQMDVTNNTETTTSQSTWLPQTSELTTSELKIIATVDSSETFPAEANSTAYSTGTRLNPWTAITMLTDWILNQHSRILSLS